MSSSRPAVVPIQDKRADAERSAELIHPRLFGSYFKNSSAVGKLFQELVWTLQLTDCNRLVRGFEIASSNSPRRQSAPLLAQPPQQLPTTAAGSPPRLAAQAPKPYPATPWATAAPMESAPKMSRNFGSQPSNTSVPARFSSFGVSQSDMSDSVKTRPANAEAAGACLGFLEFDGPISSDLKSDAAASGGAHKLWWHGAGLNRLRKNYPDAG
jgi:hypothetical protein